MHKDFHLLSTCSILFGPEHFITMKQDVFSQLQPPIKVLTPDALRTSMQ